MVLKDDMALFLFTDAIYKGKSIDIFNKGDMMRDFTYIDDIVEGVQNVVLNPAESDIKWNAKIHDGASSSAPYRIYNIGNNSPVSLGDFVSAIEGATGITAKKNFLPMQAGDVVATHANVDNLINDFNFNPSTPLQSGVDKFIQWYKT